MDHDLYTKYNQTHDIHHLDNTNRMSNPLSSIHIDDFKCEDHST